MIYQQTSLCALPRPRVWVVGKGCDARKWKYPCWLNSYGTNNPQRNPVMEPGAARLGEGWRKPFLQRSVLVCGWRETGQSGFWWNKHLFALRFCRVLHRSWHILWFAPNPSFFSQKHRFSGNSALSPQLFSIQIPSCSSIAPCSSFQNSLYPSEFPSQCGRCASKSLPQGVCCFARCFFML